MPRDPHSEPSQGLTDKQATPFILAYYARNITLRGGGTLDAGLDLGILFQTLLAGGFDHQPAADHIDSGVTGVIETLLRT